MYVYEINLALSENAEKARKEQSYHVCTKCIYEQFALEYIIYDYFTKFCGRTYNPDDADYFYLPIIKDIDYRIALAKNGNRQSSPIEQALLDAIEKNNLTLWKEVFQVTDAYWKRNNGADHILVMPAPVTNLRHQSNMRGFFHYMMQLNRPIFINVELSKSFIQEYPICAKKKIIVAPYPTTDPNVYSTINAKRNPSTLRDKLYFYHGGMHGSCIFVRQGLVGIMQHKQLATMRGDRKRELGFLTATFCPIPVGDSPSSKRMYDVMHYGCIPVLLSDDAVWAFSVTTGGPLDPASFSLQLPQSIVYKTAAEVLAKYSREEDYGYGGSRLPSSGVSLLQLLKEVDAEQQQRMPNITVSSNRALVSEKLTPTKNKGKGGGGGSGKNKKPAPTIVVREELLTPQQNTLIQILQKISYRDIRLLRAMAQNVSLHSYLYYNTSSFAPLATGAGKASSGDNKPLTASHTFPDGGAIHMLEMLLNEKKAEGISNISAACEREIKSVKHRYIGNYPCEKRRRLLGEDLYRLDRDCQAS